MHSKPFSLQNFFLLAAVVCIATSMHLSASRQIETVQRGSLAKIALPALLSFGHREFAWLLWGLGGLSAAVNAWDSETNPAVDTNQKSLTQARLRDFAQNLPEFAREQLGMREIFVFPASYLAFTTNEIDLALKIARQGIDDPRIAPDLALTVAYLIHLFKNDLPAAADAYEKLLELFPQSTWLNKTISKLRAGVDPFLDEPNENSRSCQSLLTLFPLSRQKLIERGICPVLDDNNTGAQ